MAATPWMPGNAGLQALAFALTQGPGVALSLTSRPVLSIRAADTGDGATRDDSHDSRRRRSRRDAAIPAIGLPMIPSPEHRGPEFAPDAPELLQAQRYHPPTGAAGGLPPVP